MTMNRKLGMLLVAVAMAACRPAVSKAPVHDTFTKVGKAEAAIAPLAYGATSAAVKTRGDYGWFRFTGRAGDDVEIAVRSPNGDAVAFLLDGNDDVVASNDDADTNVRDAHLALTLTAGGTYYIAFREYGYAPATFTVELAGTHAATSDVNAR
jgi:hypothetical protein